MIAYADRLQHEHFDRIGVVAAMSKNGIIGIDGDIPWNEPEDRSLLKRLTRDKIMIIGRKTFEEHPKMAHVNHLGHCIVVSRTLDLTSQFQEELAAFAPSTTFYVQDTVARALCLASQLCSDSPLSSSDKSIHCWVGGGEQVYQEVLSSPKALEVHLSIVNCEIDTMQLQESTRRACFPARENWEQWYCPPIRHQYDSFEYLIFHRKDGEIKDQRVSRVHGLAS